MGWGKQVVFLHGPVLTSHRWPPTGRAVTRQQGSGSDSGVSLPLQCFPSPV